jgi:hemerythrin
MALTWDDSLELGVAELDEQHQEIFRHFDKLSTACQSGQGENLLDEVLTFLNDYAAHHFSSEEAFMKQHGYPKLPEQEEQHAAFGQVITELRERARNGEQGRELAMAIDRQLVRYLIKHIGSADREMVAYTTAHPAA